MRRTGFKYYPDSIAPFGVYLLILILFGFCNATLSAQQTIHGIVTEKERTVPIAGVRVILKGTETGTVTALDGSFSIRVNGIGDFLIFQTVGFIMREYQVKDTGLIRVILKPSCTIDYFDNRQISFGLQTGVRTTPIGGYLSISFPYMRTPGTLWTGAQFQIGPDASFVKLQAGYDHFVSECNFRFDLTAAHTEVKNRNDVNAMVTAIGGTAHFYRLLPSIRYFNFYAGAGHMYFNQRNPSRWRSYMGPSFGFGTALFRKNQLYISSQVLLVRHHPEIQVQVRKSIRQFRFFTTFYQLNEFKEITLGAGWSFYYRKKSAGHN
jgi:hypothetical protein